MGLLSSAKSTATQQTASDEAVIVGSKGSFLESGSVNVSGKGGKFIAPNALDLSGATVRENYGIDIGSAGRDITIYSGGDNKDLLDALTNSQTQTQGLIGSLLGKVTETIQQVGEAKTDSLTGLPQPTNWKPLLGLGLGLVAAFALYKLLFTKG